MTLSGIELFRTIFGFIGKLGVDWVGGGLFWDRFILGLSFLIFLDRTEFKIIGGARFISISKQTWLMSLMRLGSLNPR